MENEKKIQVLLAAGVAALLLYTYSKYSNLKKERYRSGS